MKEFYRQHRKERRNISKKTITLTEKLFDNFLLMDMIISIHEYVYKCAMVISN